jgi:hypothetical protein
MNLKNILKPIYYQFNPQSLSADLNLKVIYVFHVEQIYNRAIFADLISFCKSFAALTGKKPVGALMTVNNPFVAQGRASHNVDEAEYLDRARQLAEVTTLGYHGHFLIDPEHPDAPSSQMKGTQFDAAAFETQFKSDLKWFVDHALDHHHLYSAGWWFMNQTVLSNLIQSGFKNDFSFSYNSYFHNPYSLNYLKSNHIPVGRSFQVTQGDQTLRCTQTLMDCHRSPFFDDFVRNLNHVVRGQTGPLIGALYSHDYDLHATNTLKCIEKLQKLKQIQFLDFDEVSAQQIAGEMTFSSL